jgi:DNA-binding transcriptional ArsR family regulator
MNEILQYLKKHGEQLDTEIAAATGIPLTNVHLHLSELYVKGGLVACRSIRFEKGNKVEGISCRLVGYIPHASLRGKPRSQLALS